jgi:GntR family transcriptional regulator/MocR family aminotransferase
VAARSIIGITLERSGSTPLYAQIARALSAEVRRGRLRPGAELPGSRSLAELVGVHRNTVLAAYAELIAEGWLVTRAGGGTFVSSLLPESVLRRGQTHERSGPLIEPGFSLRSEPEPKLETELPVVRYPLLGGVPDLRLAPGALLSRAYRRVLKARASSLLAYGDVAGEPRLREALAGLVSRRRAVVARAENVLVTRGSQMALELCARVVCSPGDRVAVEALGYATAFRVFSSAGCRLVPIPVDRSGLSVAALAQACEREPIRAVYLTPHHQYPTTVVLSAARRLELLALAARQRMAILEDDYDHEFHYEGRPVLPLASADAHANVIYLGTLSKVLAPGLRIGFVVAPERLIERLARERFGIDRQGDHVLEAAVAELIEEGTLEAHVRKMRRVYLARRDAFVDSLARRLGGCFEYVVPSGGMALWGRALGDVDVEAWSARALEREVLLMTAQKFALDGRVRPFVRLGFAALSEPELDEAVRRLAEAWPKRGAPRGAPKLTESWHSVRPKVRRKHL